MGLDFPFEFKVKVKTINPFYLNAISQSYHDWTVRFRFKGGGIFHFRFSFNRTFRNQTVETQIKRRVLRRLIWVALFVYIPQRGRWVNMGENALICINRLFAYSKGGNFNTHICAWFGCFIC